MVRTSSECRAFGERLKRQRERVGVTLQSISQTTKIPTSLFAGLERGDCSRWPAGLYSRAYIRAYADNIGINPDEAVEEFVAAFSGIVQPDGNLEGAGGRDSKPPVSLRLTMAEESGISPERLFKRTALTASDLIIGFLIASIAHIALGAGVWGTVSLALAYHAAGRLVSDDPLLFWMWKRARATSGRAPEDASAGEVAVGDAASTTA